MSWTIWRRVARARRLFPLRLGGALLLAASAWVVFSFSPAQSDFLLHPAGLVALALVLACTLVVVAGALTLRRAVSRLEPGLPDSLETRRDRPTTFRIPRLRRWLVLDLRLEWLWPEAVAVELEPAGAWLEEYVRPRQRGRFTQVTRRFTVEDVFGLAGVTFDVTWQTPLRIAPAIATSTTELASTRSHGDSFSHPAGNAEGDLVEMRQYADGDSMRHVLWKTYARSRRLLVRMPERALAPRPLNVAFLVTGQGDEPSAGTARLYVERGLLGADFVFSADGAARPARTPAEAVEQIVDSAAARGDGGATLDSLAAQIDPARLASCLVFAPPVDGPWRARLVALVRRRSIAATVVIGVDDPGEPEPRGRLQRFLLRAPDDAPERRALLALPALRAALEADGLRVHVVHRSTGRVL